MRPALLAIALFAAACSRGPSEGAAPEAGLEERLPAGEIVRNEPIVLADRSALIGSGRGRTILKAGRKMDALVANHDVEAGTTGVLIADLTIDCDRKATRGVFLIRASDLIFRNVELRNCLSDGARISGHGKHTRGAVIENVWAHHNRGAGLYVMWAMRDVMYSNVLVERNGGDGIVFDHSELVANNVIARDNNGDGIFIRNVFATAFTNLAAQRNKQHGVNVVGWLASTGSSWRSQGNGMAEPDRFDDIHFSAQSDLSYGATDGSVLSGVVVGGFREIHQKPQVRHAIFVGEGVGSLDLEDVAIGVTMSEPICRPCAAD